MNDPGRTIVAPASGSGGAIALIRVSGSDAFGLTTSLFSRRSRSTGKIKPEGYTISYGDIKDGDELVDDVLVSWFRKPHSYTGEDMVEISCHASSYIIQKILSLLIKTGASPANPGEFTMRAFMNGKMDLSQAEAVADIIASESEAAHRMAVRQIRGGFSKDIQRLRDELLHFASLIELELDFSEEDVEFADRTDLKLLVMRVKELTDNLAASFRMGNAIKKGLPVAIVGAPNTGKSTLMNGLLKDDRAIVSDIPGTTRDTIEDTLIIDGVLFRFIDTAGLRETDDTIEKIGIKKTLKKMEEAAVILYLVEATDNLKYISNAAGTVVKSVQGKDQKAIVVINKTDLATAGQLKEIEKQVCTTGSNCILLSALSEEDINRLKGVIGVVAGIDNIDLSSSIVTNVRHFEALSACSASLERVLEGLESGLTEDLIAMDLRQAIHYLGEITGEITTDDILENIFRNFCIGK